MKRLWPSSACAVFVLAIGCSHPQKVAQAPTPAAQPRTAARSPAQQKQASPSVAKVASKNKEEAIYFDFDSSILRDDARPVLQEVAESARQKEKSVNIEGNCDELGTVEYNLALGDQRARSAKEYLVHMGVPADHITTVSYGSQRPKYPGHDDGDRAKNRRDDLVVR